MRRFMLFVLAAGLLVGLIGCNEPATKKGTVPEKTVKPAAGKVTPAPAGKVALRVNCGATADYVDLDGNKWLADQVWAEGKTWGALDGMTVTRTLAALSTAAKAATPFADERAAMPGTRAPAVYLSERYALTGYRFDVPNGKYTVRLHFAETYHTTGPGARVVTVSLQGNPVFERVDATKDGGGFAKPCVKEAKGVTVTDGKLLIKITQVVMSPEINGIEILSE
jgi:hypothetical protein